MGVTDKFLVKKQVDFVTAWEYEDVETFEGAMYITKEVYGFKVIENTFDGISVDGRIITMGDGDIARVVFSDAQTICKDADMDGKLPSLYCVRKRDGSFVCGFDLCSNGMLWLGMERNGIFFSHINNALHYLNDRLYGDFEIHTEEPMLK